MSNIAPGCLSLTNSRYALDKGAAALAVDIEEAAEHEKSRSPKSAIRISLRDEQRRSEGLMKEEPGGFKFSHFPLENPGK